MADTRTLVELAIPPRLFLGLAKGTTFSCFDSRGNARNMKEVEELFTIRSQLTRAMDEPFAGLPPYKMTTAMNYLDRAADAAFVELEGQTGVKVMRTLSWWLSTMITGGKIELWQGSLADLAITKLMDWTENTFDLMKPRETDALDASAQKQARRMAEHLRACGYFL